MHAIDITSWRHPNHSERYYVYIEEKCCSALISGKLSTHSASKSLLISSVFPNEPTAQFPDGTNIERDTGPSSTFTKPIIRGTAAKCKQGT